MWKLRRFGCFCINLEWSLVLLPAIALATLVSCTKTQKLDARVQFPLPPNPDVSTKSLNASSATSQPNNFCYIVQVRGSGISAAGKACYPEKGIATEPLAPLALVELSVPRGTGRIFELYGYIPKLNETCLTAPRSLHDLPLNRVFQMGRIDGVNTDTDTVTVALSVSFPGINKHVGLTSGAEASCYANLPPIVSESDSQSPTPILNGTDYSLRGQASSGALPVALRGAHYRIHQGVISGGPHYQINQGAVDVER